VEDEAGFGEEAGGGKGGSVQKRRQGVEKEAVFRRGGSVQERRQEFRGRGRVWEMRQGVKRKNGYR
jgi:hypothetical protein